MQKSTKKNILNKFKNVNETSDDLDRQLSVEN